MVKKHHSDRKEAKGRILQSTNTIDDEPYLYSSDASIEDFDKELVRDWMTPNPISVGSETSLIDASWLMIERNIRRLPVIDIGALIGLITLEDIRCVIPPSAVRSNSPIYKKKPFPG